MAQQKIQHGIKKVKASSSSCGEITTSDLSWRRFQFLKIKVISTSRRSSCGRWSSHMNCEAKLLLTKDKNVIWKLILQQSKDRYVIWLILQKTKDRSVIWSFRLKQEWSKIEVKTEAPMRSWCQKIKKKQSSVEKH